MYDKKRLVGAELVESLKQIADGLRICEVNGDRVLISVVLPRIEADRVEERSKVIIPDHLKKKHTPLPSTGIIVKVGDAAAEKGWREQQAVMFSPYMGSNITESGRKDLYRILETREILCTLEAIGDDISDIIKIPKAA